MRDRTLVFALVIVPLFGTLLIGWLSANVTYTATWQGKKLEVTRDGRWIHRTGIAEPEPEAANSLDGTPEAVAPELAYDFGIMNPLTMGRHAFVLRNEGSAALVLRKGPTSCKCTLSNLSTGKLAPGEETQVVLDWNSGRDILYSHQATIYTNDPDHDALQFQITGRVRQRLGAAPESVSFGGVEPGGQGQVDLIVYSQVWDDFDIIDGECSVAGVTWTVDAVQPQDATLVDVRAAKGLLFAEQTATYAVFRSARKLTITTAANMPQGPFAGHLRLNVQPASGEQQHLELPVTGQILRRLAVYGPSITVDGVIDMGQVEQGQGKKSRLVLKVRDPQRQLAATHIKTYPPYLKASVLPYSGAPRAGMMHLEVEIPASAPECSYLGVPLGDVRIEFAHPRIQELELKVKFAVVREKRKEG